jgi:ubiquinone/menaquinone biosynthesis C-methylase UbiE
MTFSGWLKDYNQAERLLWQNPQDVLSRLELKSGDTFLDIGCGDGFFALPAAVQVGSQGWVYGLDVSPEALEKLKTRAGEAGLSNIHLVLGNAEEVLLCNTGADVVLLANVLHDFSFPLKVLERVSQVLKPHGLLAVVEWEKLPMQHGPPLAKRLERSRTQGLLETAGFSLQDLQTTGPFHYLVTARSPAAAAT